MRLLLKAGAQVDTVDNEGYTPFARAAYEGFTDIMKSLYAAGARLEARDTDGDTPLSAAVRGEHHDTVRQLLDWGADMNVRNNDEESPFDIAGEQDNNIEDLLKEEKKRRDKAARPANPAPFRSLPQPPAAPSPTT